MFEVSLAIYYTSSLVPGYVYMLLVGVVEAEGLKEGAPDQYAYAMATEAN